MARLVTAGAEFGHRNSDGLILGGVANIVSTPVRSGDYAYSVQDNATNYVRVSWTKTVNRWFRIRTWMRITGLPSTSCQIAMLYETNTIVNSVYLRPTGELSQTASGGSVSEPIAPNTWFCLELAAWGNTGFDRKFIARLNGEEFINESSGVTPGTFGNNYRIGWPGGGGSEGLFIYSDDIALNDDTGGNQNSWPEINGRIILLLANEDVAVGNWTLGLGTAVGDRYESVNNTPPVGAIYNESGSDSKQIRNVSNVITSPAADIDFRCSPYSSKIVSDGVINLVQSLCFITGSSFSSQNVQHGLISEPTATLLTPATQPAGSSTYPGDWDRFVGPVVSDPVVDLSDQPVVRIGKRSATTSALLCCGVGVLVEYEGEDEPVESSGSQLKMVV